MKNMRMLPGLWVTVGLLAIVLFALGFPDPHGAARAILTEGNLKLFLWLPINQARPGRGLSEEVR